MENETLFSKIKIFIFGFGSAIAAFMFFMLRGKDIHDNGNTVSGTEPDNDGLEDIAEGFERTKRKIEDANSRLEQIIGEIEKTGVEN